MQWGTDEQERRYLPEIVRGRRPIRDLLLQPYAGTDLASISTRARQHHRLSTDIARVVR